MLATATTRHGARGLHPRARSTRRSGASRRTTSTSTSITRRTSETPLEETFGASKELVEEGKIRAVGTSNYAPATLEQAARIAQSSASRTSPSRASTRGSRRDAEHELLPTCERLGLGFIPYFPLASGLLTGKVSRDRPPAEGTRLHGSEIDDEQLDRVERFAPGPRRTASRCSTSRSAASPPSRRSRR